MRIATAGSKNSKRWRTQEITWDAVLGRLREPLRTGETFAEYQRMDKEDKDRKKGAAGGFVGGAMSGGRRIAGAVTERWLITLDADEAGKDDWEEAQCLFDHCMAVYSTHSHSPSKPRLRWIVPLRRGVSREEYEPLARMVAAQLGILESLDPTTYQPERLMYWPTCAQDGEYLYHEQDGAVLDPDILLREYGPDEAWKDTTIWPIGSREKEIVRRALKKQADPESKGGIVGAFCRTYDIPSAIDTFLPDLYEEAGDGRYTYTQGSTSAGAVVYGEGAWLYSNHATDPTWGQLCKAFDLVRLHKFGALDEGHENQETTRLPSYKAMGQWCAELPEVKRQMAEEAAQRAMDDFSDLAHPAPGTDDGGADAGGEAEDRSWVEQLTVDPKSKDVESTPENVRTIVLNDPRLKGIWYNEMLDRCVIRGQAPPWYTEGRRGADMKNGVPWGNSDAAALRTFMSQKWHIRGKKDVIKDGWLTALLERRWHPVKDYLLGLEWDGTARVETMFHRWFGAEDNAYTRAVARKWMSAAVARVMEPGIKFDCMPVIVGPQGVGKSRFPRILAKDPAWFSDTVPNMNGNKDSFEPLRGKWIVEIAELAAAKRSESESIKNFISKSVDSYRQAYGEFPDDFPRQCVFWGTTNDAEFLKDRTGDRRFWPIEVPGIDHGVMRGLEDEVDQLWAEAVELYRAGESRWMDTAELQQLARQAQDEHTIQDEQIGQILEYLDTPLPENWDSLDKAEKRAYFAGSSVAELGVCDVRRDVVCIAELRWELFGEDAKNRGRSMELAGIMNNLPGWKKLKKLVRVDGWGPQRVYQRIRRGPEQGKA